MTAWSISRAVLDLTDRSLSDYNLCKSREMVSCQSLRYMFEQKSQVRTFLGGPKLDYRSGGLGRAEQDPGTAIGSRRKTNYNNININNISYLSKASNTVTPYSTCMIRIVQSCAISTTTTTNS